MEVVYDVSLLGFCKDDPAKITGMPRVVLEQAARLQTTPECAVAFCASEDSAEAYPVVQRHPAFHHARVFPWPDAAALARAQVFHTPHSAVPDEVRARPGLAVVQTVYDMIPFLLPETFTAEYRDYYGDIIARLRPSDHVITISQSAKADFCRHTGFTGERVRVIPLAADARLFHPRGEPERLAAVRAKYAIPGDAPYLLSVCTFEPRKNLRHVIRAFLALTETQPNLGDLRLVLAGGRGWMFEPILAELAGCPPKRATGSSRPATWTTPTSRRCTAARWGSSTCRATRGSACLRWRRCSAARRSSRRTRAACPRWSATRASCCRRTIRTVCASRCSILSSIPPGAPNCRRDRSGRRGGSVGRRTIRQTLAVYRMAAGCDH